MPITTNDFQALTDDLQEIYAEHASENIADMVGMEKMFDVRDTDRKSYDYQVVHGVSVIEAVPEGKDLPSGSAKEGDNATWTQQRYGGIVAVTKDMRLFDLYDKIEEVVKSAADEALDKIDQSAVDVLLYGWSASYNDVYGKSQTATTPDGLTLFSAVHSNPVTSNTFSNLITEGGVADPALSREAVKETRARALKHRDVHNLTRPTKLDTLSVGPDNEDLAERILFSPQIPGEANNDINALKGKIKNLIVWERQDLRSDGTDTSNYYFMSESRRVKQTLRMHFRERPEMDAPEQVYESKNWEYSIDYYNFLGRAWPAFIYGGRGTA